MTVNLFEEFFCVFPCGGTISQHTGDLRFGIFQKLHAAADDPPFGALGDLEVVIRPCRHLRQV